jgi:AraC-like DNA-binding protein
LRHAVEYFWLTEPSATGVYESMPDGRVDVVLVCSAVSPRFELYGPATRRQEMRVEPGAVYAGIRLRPEYAGMILAEDAWRIADTLLVLPRFGGYRPEEVADGATPETLFTKLSAAVRVSLSRRPSQGHWTRRAIAALEETAGMIRVEALADDIGVSRRKLERVFASEVGVTPKHFARITRLRALCDRLRGETRVPWSGLAADLGYADQAHLIRDVEQLTDHRPTDLQRRLSQMPSDWV